MSLLSSVQCVDGIDICIGRVGIRQKCWQCTQASLKTVYAAKPLPKAAVRTAELAGKIDENHFKAKAEIQSEQKR